MLLIHGARSVLCYAKKTQEHDRLRTWALDLQRRVGHNKAAVALANQLARIAWAVWKNDRAFESLPSRTGEREADNSVPNREAEDTFAVPTSTPSPPGSRCRYLSPYGVVDELISLFS